MNLLINCSNLKMGGALQVADSVCRYLNNFTSHFFVVVLSSAMDDTAERICTYSNCKIIRHDIRNDLNTILFGKDGLLDKTVVDNKIDVVLTLFGPARWMPSCKHMCGFARAQLVCFDSPFYKRMSFMQLMREKIINFIMEIYFRRRVDKLWTENPFISERLRRILPQKDVVTVTNYYNQIFDNKSQWNYHTLQNFDGIRLLSVTGDGKWKNNFIAYEVTQILKIKYPEFKFRFVMTLSEAQFGVNVAPEYQENFEFIGSVPITSVPSLYKQTDILFQPTLLECFTATYPEAMRMERPIITTDLPFARGLCGNAARYYEATNAEACADAIYEVATNEILRSRLIAEGKKQLQTFDNYKERANKLIQEAILLGKEESSC